MAETPEAVDLETFLAGLPAEDAAELRVAAAEIEALEREVGPPGWIERNLVTLTLTSLVLFALGLAGLIGVLAGLTGVIGLGGIVLLVAAFPVLMLAYLWSVRGRTRVDKAKMTLNDRHFLPHGGVYFGARGNGKVVRVAPPQSGEPNLRQRTEALHATATRRRWWW